MSLPESFVYVRDVITDVREDMRYFGANNFMGRPVTGYEAPRAILTVAAADALANVQADLRPWDLKLQIFDAYRPQRAVSHFLRWEQEAESSATRARFHPDLSKQDLFRQGYIASRSSHSRGSTVDLSLVSRDDEELDMATEFDFFGIESAPDYLKLDVQQRANRLLLRSVMEKHGFTGFALEWWHFTLLDEPYPDQYFDFPVA